MNAIATRATQARRRTAATFAFPLNPFAAGCAVLLSVLAGNAYAQASGSEEATPVAPNTPVAAATVQTPQGIRYTRDGQFARDPQGGGEAVQDRGVAACGVLGELDGFFAGTVGRL